MNLTIPSALIYAFASIAYIEVDYRVSFITLLLFITSIMNHSRPFCDDDAYNDKVSMFDKTVVALTTLVFILKYNKIYALWYAIIYMVTVFKIVIPYYRALCKLFLCEVWHVSFHLVTGFTMIYLSDKKV